MGCASLSTCFGICGVCQGGEGGGIPGGGGRGNPEVGGGWVEVPILGQNRDAVDDLNRGKVLHQ